MDLSDRVINVYSEIGKLRKVVLHRPGKELENLVPDYLERLLFDDIPYLELAQKEHDYFADVLRNNGAEVLYIEDLAAESIEDDNVKKNLLEEYLNEANVYDSYVRDSVLDYFSRFDNRGLIDKMIAGIRKEEIENKDRLRVLLDDGYPFIIDPMPNLYFTRDPFVSLGNGITINHMRTVTRNRETLFIKYIFENHKMFKDKNIPIWTNRDMRTSIEGGDILILSNKTIAVGVSQRTDPLSVAKLAEKVLKDERNTFETVLAFYIPVKRAFMHLDTVFTMIDRDKFTIHPEIEDTLTVYVLRKDKLNEGELDIIEERMSLEDVLKKYVGLDNVSLIRCAGGNKVDAPREQWNDGSNTLTIAPGEVVVYDRNYITNRILEENGVKTHVIPSSELSRGRGGPRCMSMPLYREDL